MQRKHAAHQTKKSPSVKRKAHELRAVPRSKPKRKTVTRELLSEISKVGRDLRRRVKRAL